MNPQTVSCAVAFPSVRNCATGDQDAQLTPESTGQKKPRSIGELRAQLLAQPERNQGALLALVDRVADAYRVPHAERQEMRRVALADFDSALICYTALAANPPRWG